MAKIRVPARQMMFMGELPEAQVHDPDTIIPDQVKSKLQRVSGKVVKRVR